MISNIDFCLPEREWHDSACRVACTQTLIFLRLCLFALIKRSGSVHKAGIPFELVTPLRLSLEFNISSRTILPDRYPAKYLIFFAFHSFRL